MILTVDGLFSVKRLKCPHGLFSSYKARSGNIYKVYSKRQKIPRQVCRQAQAARLGSPALDYSHGFSGAGNGDSLNTGVGERAIIAPRVQRVSDKYRVGGGEV